MIRCVESVNLRSAHAGAEPTGYPDICADNYLTLKCDRCGQEWRVPVPNRLTDWRMYERRYLSMAASINSLIKRCQASGNWKTAMQRLSNQLDKLRENYMKENEKNLRNTAMQRLSEQLEKLRENYARE